MLETLGFVIHPQKSTFEPHTSIEFLGFIINSINMTVSLTEKKKLAIQAFCAEVLSAEKNTIRCIAQLGGKFSSSFIAVPEGKLYFRNMDRDKTKALALNKGNFDKYMKLSSQGIEDITWWYNNIMSSVSPILRENPSIVITTDASMKGWGACYNGARTGDLFAEREIEHINVLETKAVYFGLQSLCSEIRNQHIKVLADNSATVGAINSMGSSKSSTD